MGTFNSRIQKKKCWRPSGQTAKQWMKENGIGEQTYYLRQRRIRKETYEQMASSDLWPIVSGKEEITFAEILISENSSSDVQEPAIHPITVIKTNGCSIVSR